MTSEQREGTIPEAILNDRYQLCDVIGRGGMATVHRAFDTVQRRHVALKQRSLSGTKSEHGMFEREFHVLSSLSHPSIIEVYDYAVDDAGPYYTMELLDGGDLREQSPLPWQRACALLYDVCSSLALIHSRRFVHRDIGPRNIRCTNDGRAKLIDFGAMVPMGYGELVVGTPAFTAPEVFNLSMLDARTDLFSLGATLYFALTGRAAFPVKRFAELEQAWQKPPNAPSRFVPEIPEALDALVLSLLSLEPATRPRTAFEVMQRLGAIAGIERAEEAGVSRAYLSTPVLVGRDPLLAELRLDMTRAFAGEGRTVMVDAAPGLGRTRVLEHCILEAKASGATVLRARPTSANANGSSFAESLGSQLLQALGNGALEAAHGIGLYSTLFEFGEPVSTHSPEADGAAVLPRLQAFGDGAAGARQQEAFVKWFLAVTTQYPVIVVMDDVHRFGEGPTALLATLADDAPERQLMMLLAAESGAAPASGAFLTLKQRSKTLRLEVLTEAHTQALLASLFGDVPNVGILGHSLHVLSRGNPRACLDLAQHLVDRRAIQYGGGTWSLPSRIDPSDLPESAEAAIRSRIAGLGPLARTIAESQALASQATFSREDYGVLAGHVDSSALEGAMTELVVNQILVSDGGSYSLAHRGWASSLTAGLSPAERAERHRALVEIYRLQPGLAAVHHMLEGGLEEAGLSRLFELLGTVQNSNALREIFKLDAHETAVTFARALRATVELGRPAREVNTIRRWLASLSVASDESFYWMAAPEWLDQLKRDSGYATWEELKDVTDVDERRSRAVSSAFARHAALPENERVYSPDEAIRLLVHYVAISIAIGSRCQEVSLIRSLPRLLEPFAPLSAGVDAILHNAMATCEARAFGQPERARRRWLDVYERLGTMTPDQVESLAVIRHAIASGIGSVEAQMGIASAREWAERLERDPLQQVHALYLRKVVHLQQGDWEGADRSRRKAEMLEISARARQMFTSSLMIEVAAHALACDLTGLKQVIDRIEPFAARFPGWVPYAHLARGRFEQIRGDLDAARREYELALERSTPDPSDPSRALPAFAPASAGLVETLTLQGAAGEAFDVGQRALAECAKVEMGVVAHELARATAVADAKLGNFARAAEAIERVIAEQVENGITGLNLGASYEARARIAIWAGDQDAVNEYASLTAREYRHRHGSPLGARYERLMEEAVRSGSLPSYGPGAFESVSAGVGGSTPRSHDAAVTEAMTGAETRVMRGQRALRLLANKTESAGALLYLFDASGLHLAASIGELSAPDGLVEFLEDKFTAEREEMRTMTMAIPSGSTLPAEAAAFTDAGGVVHEPILLTCVLDNTVRHAGVAVLASRDAPRRAATAVLASALAAHLIRSGDTQGAELSIGLRAD
ncbi:MAG TPA: serine/threonine-protein kinase [Polyangiaceae bacterium]|nr:serine/threonine-protein kinase [Polyangiaceae bacterium]